MARARRFRLVVRGVAVLTLSAAGLAALQGVAAAATPTITVTPSNNLRDGDQVIVTGSNFSPGMEVTLAECDKNHSSACDPTTETLATTNASGGFSVSFTARQHLMVAGAEVDCTYGPSFLNDCLISARTSTGEAAGQGLAFARATLQASPSSNLSDGAQVQVTGSGFNPGIEVTIRQCQIFSCESTYAVSATTDGSGVLPPTAFTVRQIITHDGQELECNACLIFASASSGPSGSAQINVGMMTSANVLAEPQLGLTDAAATTVNGIGFAPGSTVEIVQCSFLTIEGSSPPELPCDTATLRTTIAVEIFSGLGGFENVAFPVREVLTATNDGGRAIDCRTSMCVIQARSGSKVGWARIAFGPPTLSVPPGVLLDNQPIEVRGEHLLGLTRYYVGQCRILPGTSQCDLNYGGAGLTHPSTDSSGSFVTTLMTRQILESSSGATVDCAVDECRIVAFPEILEPPVAVSPRLRFGPGAPTAAPTDVSGTVTLDGVATISYVQIPPVEDGGSPLTGYRATCRADGEVDLVGDDGEAPFEAIEIAGLVSGASYSCVVQAFNALGIGPDSEPVIIIGPGPPGVPTAVSVTEIDAATTTVAVGYSPPDSDGGASITSYEATCRASGHPEVTGTDSVEPFESIALSGLVRGVNYACSVRASNVLGSGPESEPAPFFFPDVPGAPTNVSVAAAGDGVVSVSYGPPQSDGGLPITSYEAFCHATGSPRRGEDTEAPFEAITVTGLIKGTTYSCRVQAFNAIGEGEKSDKVDFTVPFAPAGAPSGVVAAVAADREVEVSYTAVPTSLDGGTEITRYEATCRAPGQDDRSEVDASSPFETITIRGLARGVTYSCVVRAGNVVGWGPESLPVAVAVPDVPGAPRDAAVSVTADRTVEVSYSPPASDGGATITRYDATCRASGQPDRSATDDAAPFDAITMTGLTRGVTYSCVIRAANLAGTGDDSEAAQVLVPDVPGAARDVTAAVTGDGQVSVDYNPPSSDGGASITRYDATCRASGQPDRSGIDDIAPFEAITVTGLTRGVTYSCTVRATNLAGTGDESAPAQVFVPYPPQVAPTNVFAVPIGFEAALVSYEPIDDSANGGAPIIGYRAVCRATGQPERYAEDRQTPFEAITVSGLTRGVAYACTVQAFNIAGFGPESAPGTVIVV